MEVRTDTPCHGGSDFLLIHSTQHLESISTQIFEPGSITVLANLSPSGTARNSTKKAGWIGQEEWNIPITLACESLINPPKPADVEETAPSN